MTEPPFELLELPLTALPPFPPLPKRAGMEEPVGAAREVLMATARTVKNEIEERILNVMRR